MMWMEDSIFFLRHVEISLVLGERNVNIMV